MVEQSGKPAPSPQTAPSSEHLGTGRPESLGRVAIVGPLKRRQMLRRALAPLPVGVVTAATPRQLPRAIPNLRATIVTMSREYSILRGIRRLRTRSVPIVTVIPAETHAGAVAQMYESGAEAVAAWPEEAFLLAEMMATLLDGGVSARDRGRDEIMGKAVALRIGIQFNNTPIRSTVERGVCTLEGTVSSLLKKMELVSLVESIPGIESVLSAQVEAENLPANAKELTANIRSALQYTDGVESITICAAADETGVVTVAGTTASERERDLMRRVIAGVPGVRAINDLCTLSISQKQRDRQNQRRAELALQSEITAPDRLRVSIFGPVGFVAGRVKNIAQHHAAERVLREQTPVDRVINEIRVEP